MGNKFEMNQLYCLCPDPAMYKADSGHMWCEDCSGLVSDERIQEIERYCKCEHVPGTFIKRSRPGSAEYGCSGCKKEIHPKREIRSGFEICLELEEKGHDGAIKLLGPAAFICGFCEHMEMVAHNEDVGYMVGMIRRQRNFICPRCRKVNKLSGEWEVMFK